MCGINPFRVPQSVSREDRADVPRGTPPSNVGSSVGASVSTGATLSVSLFSHTGKGLQLCDTAATERQASLLEISPLQTILSPSPLSRHCPRRPRPARLSHTAPSAVVGAGGAQSRLHGCSPTFEVVNGLLQFCNRSLCEFSTGLGLRRGEGRIGAHQLRAIAGDGGVGGVDWAHILTSFNLSDRSLISSSYLSSFSEYCGGNNVPC